ncbi:MAG: ABC transporter permease subunit, partial [Proteobacteria bacterium]|nr:ABC transporter permease subunit [Pseudomonadota bacterium]
VVSIAYVSFWLGLSILFSIFFRSVATSALAAVAFWIFFSFFIPFGSNLLASAVVPIDNPEDVEQVMRYNKVARSAILASPVILYTEATSGVLDPFRRTTKSLIRMGRMEQISMSRFRNPLPLDQSILVVVPYLTTILGLTVICFGVSYMAFMRQEIRSA